MVKVRGCGREGRGVERGRVRVRVNFEVEEGGKDGEDDCLIIWRRQKRREEVKEEERGEERLERLKV